MGSLLFLNFERFRLGDFPYIPVNVKLWESPGRAGGLPVLIIATKIMENPAMALTKISMISKLCEEIKLDRKKATESVEKIIEIIKSSLADGDAVLISGFGKFSVNQKNSRKGRNPATSEDLMLPARKVVVFKYSGKLRDQMNKGKGK